MPTPRRAGGTSLTTRSSKRTSPPSGRSKPATSRSVVVLPHPEPPTSATSSPGAISRESPSTAVDAPKRLLTSRRLMRMALLRVFLLPQLHEPFLVLRITGLHEVEIDQLHLRDLRPAHRHVRSRDARAAPLGVRRHRGLRDGPVEKPLRVRRILRALHEPVGLERPRHAVRGPDDVDRRALLLGHLHLVRE